jgi:outer membrane receptor protein involved in Fe transport
LSLGATVTHVGDRIQGFVFNSTRVNLDAYTVVDLRAGLKLADWALNLFVNNATDEQGVLRSGFPASNHSGYTQPLTMGFSVARSF